MGIADTAETVEEASLLDKREEGVAAATTPAEAAVISPAGAIVTAPEAATVTTPSGATMTTPAAAPSECRICSEVLPLAIFLPCNHQVACNECSVKMKKCLLCGESIIEKVSTSPTN